MPISLTTPSGIFRQPELLRRLIAYSTTWQTIVGALNQTEAMDSTLTFEAVENFAQKPPMAVINTHNMKRVETGVGDWSVSGGELYVSFHIYYDMPETAQEFETAKIDFQNDISAIMLECEASKYTEDPLTPGETFLNFKGYTVIDEPWFQAISEQRLPDDPDSEVIQALWTTKLQVEWM